MEKSTGLLSQFAFALMLVAGLSAAAVARGDARPVQQQPVRQNSNASHANSQAPRASSLPESRALTQNDDLLPTQNRSQAMAIEAENGKLPSGEEEELKRRGVIKQIAPEQKR